MGRVLQSHRLFGDSWESRGGPLWTPHFCRALCSVTVPNETPRSCGSALLICGSGRHLGEIAVTASAAFPFAASSKASCCLLTEEAHCNVSSRPRLRLFASRAETIYHFSGHLLQTLQDGWKAAWNKSNLGSRSNTQALATSNSHCSYNMACPEKSNLGMLQSWSMTTITGISSQQDSRVRSNPLGMGAKIGWTRTLKTDFSAVN